MIINDIKNAPAISAGAAVKYGFSAMRFNSSAVMKVFLLVIVPVCILNAYLMGMMADVQGSVDLTMIFSNPELIEQFVLSPEYIRILVLNLLSMLIDGMLIPFGSMAVIYIVKEAFEEKKADYKDALNVSFSCGVRFVICFILYSLSIAVCSMFMAIPGIILSIVWYFYIHTLVLEDCKGIKAFGASREITNGRWFKTVMYMITFYCMNYVVSYFLGIAFAGSTESFLANVIASSMLCYLSLIFTAAKTAVYINFKANKIVKKNKVMKN